MSSFVAKKLDPLFDSAGLLAIGTEGDHAAREMTT
jgi:hypothetical protein